MVGETKRSLVIEMLVHLVLIAAVAFALYPVLWVVSLALSASEPAEARILPIPSPPSLHNFATVVGNTARDGTWLFGWQLFNSVFIASFSVMRALRPRTSRTAAADHPPRAPQPQSRTVNPKRNRAITRVIG